MKKKTNALQKRIQTIWCPSRLEYATKQAVIEGCVRIKHYEQNRIVLQTTAGTLGFEGDGLRICRMADGIALVRGHIVTIHIEEDAVCG